MAGQEALIEILEKIQIHLHYMVQDDINELLGYISSHKEYGLIDMKYEISIAYKEFLYKVKEAIREIKEKENETFN